MRHWLSAVPMFALVTALLVVGCSAQRITQTGRDRSTSISAAPNPVPGGNGAGTTTIRWSTGDSSTGEVYLSVDGTAERLFAQGAQGSEEAPWIESGHTYEFHLYTDAKRSALAGTVSVTRDAGPGSTSSVGVSLLGSFWGAPPAVLLVILVGTLLLVGASLAFRRGQTRTAKASQVNLKAAKARTKFSLPGLQESMHASLTGLVTLASTIAVLSTPVRPLPDQPFPDAQEYAGAAQQLAAGHGYVTYVQANEPLPPRYPPGFSLALAPFAFDGEYPLNVQAGSKLLAAAYIVATAGVAWMIGGSIAAALAAAVIGISPFATTSASLVMSDAFAAALTVLLVGVLYQVSKMRAIGAGILAGVLVLVRLSSLFGFVACVAVVPRRLWVYIVVAALPFLAALGLYQWATFGSPIRTGYDYWLPDLRTFDPSFALRTHPQGDGPYIVADRLNGALAQPLCACPGQSPQIALPNVAFYPAVLIGLLWIFAPPLWGLFGLAYTWSRRREPAFALILWLTLVTFLVQIFYFYQGARFMAGPATLLAIGGSVGLGRWIETRLFGRPVVANGAVAPLLPVGSTSNSSDLCHARSARPWD